MFIRSHNEYNQIQNNILLSISKCYRTLRFFHTYRPDSIIVMIAIVIVILITRLLLINMTVIRAHVIPRATVTVDIILYFCFISFILIELLLTLSL